MNDNFNRNVLNNRSYIFNEELLQNLHSDSFDIHLKEKEVKHPEGLYLVMFRVLNLKTNVLIYNYIYYPKYFLIPLFTYMLHRNNQKASAVISEWGDFLTIFDITLHQDFCVEDKLALNYSNSNLKELLSKIGSSQFVATDIYSTLNLINKLTYLADYKLMSKLISIAIIKDYMGFVQEILNSVKDFSTLMNKIKNVNGMRSVNLINPCLFVVRDLDVFVNNLIDKGISVNCGPQPLRGQVNSISNFLSCFDMDFRKALYNHNNYHVQSGLIDQRFWLNKDKFSFKNIHMNLGLVRYYSSRRSVNSNNGDKFSFKNIHMNLGNTNYYSTSTKSVNGEFSLVKQKKELLAKSIFQYLKRFLQNNPINHETQKKVESYVLSQYNWWESAKLPYSMLGVDMDVFSSKFSKLLIEQREIISAYIDKVKHSKNTSKTKSMDPFSPKNNAYYLSKIIDKLDKNKMMDLILYNFLKLVTYNNSDYENTKELQFAIAFGKNICREYLVTLYKEYLKSNKNIQFSVWKVQHENMVQVFEDNNRLFDFIGTRMFVELLIQADLIHEEIVINRDVRDKQFKMLGLNKEVSQLLGNNEIYVAPLKLPMIVEPKPYTFNELGGYLLNDVETTEDLIIHKANYKQQSIIVKDNIIYDMVNNMNKTPYKINKEVLKFILEFGVEFGMIDDVNEKHEFEYVKKRTKRQDKIYRAYKSKILLEQNILGVADTYAGMSLYFPVRLDQRGRIYCEPLYFNYQSNELAKSLISFTLPGIINRKDTTSIEYFKAYGANCFGHSLDKKSYIKRVAWVNDNIVDVIDYKNGKLLRQAKDKCLFLAFCLEYARFAEFLEQDSLEFQTYLPIQLDATCNGFQHLALLSNETKIFKELNISKTSKVDDPEDFYTFMKNALTFIFKKKSTDLKVSECDRESYRRLNDFLWDRKNFKQAIMTMPYNAALTSMIKYIKDTLKICEFNEEEFEIYKENEKLKKNKKFKLIKPISRWFGRLDQVIPERMVNDKDINLLAKAINGIISNDFPKIAKLSDYLLNVAEVCTSLNIPICWSLPSGLHVFQTYLMTKTATIKPFTFINSSFKLRVSDKNKLDMSKQKMALMPNLIHSLDSTSLSLLYDRFYVSHKPIVNFYAIHDCFTTTCDKVESLINLLKVVYLSVYTKDNYLRKFDEGIIESIKYHYSNDCTYNNDNRTFTIENRDYKLYDIEEVLGKNLPTTLTSDLIRESQYLVI